VLIDLLWDHIKDDPQLGSIISSKNQISLLSPEQMKIDSSAKLSLFLCNISVYTHLENQKVPPTPSLFLKLQYLITPYTQNRESALELLAEVMRIFHDNAILSRSILRNAMAENNEDIRITMDQLSIDQFCKIWTALRKPYRLCVSYSVAPVRIESTREMKINRFVRKKADFNHFGGGKAQSAIPFAIKITPRYSWEDLVLPDDKKKQLKEVGSYVKNYSRVYESWGFEKHSIGKGLNFMFSGPSGTGKTMAAEILASDLKLPMYRIGLSMVVNKYIGETEKNLNRIFEDAEKSNAILFFDEADALFGKRTEVKDAHDRYANVKISYLLQKMEEHEGIVILATSHKKEVDDAFTRRLQFIVEFPFPNEECRLEIWKKVFPEITPKDDIDFDFLSKLKLSGGEIRDIAVTAAFLSAENSDRITLEQIIKAVKREYRKKGRVFGKREFGKYYDLIKD
jgi:AAA+ superfamily predicted ATPase